MVECLLINLRTPKLWSLRSGVKNFKKKKINTTLLPFFGLGDNSRGFSIIVVFSLANDCRENNNKNNLTFDSCEKAKLYYFVKYSVLNYTVLNIFFCFS